MDSVVRFFQEGGVFMFPIAVVLAIGLAVFVERLLFLLSAQSKNKTSFTSLFSLLNKGELGQALKSSNEDKSGVGKMISAGLKQLQLKGDRTSIEYAIEESLLDTTPLLEKRTNYVATLANIATLLGLLGTIMGLIEAFTAVANADPAEKATLLSQSISVAMNTTAFGLMAAIPLLLCHAFLQSRTNQVLDSLESTGLKFINVTHRKKAGSSSVGNKE